MLLIRHASEKEDQLSKKKGGLVAHDLVFNGWWVVVMGKSMVGLEGKYKGNRMLLRVLVV